jgi:hypothetical protein
LLKIYSKHDIFYWKDDGPSIEEFIQSHKSLWKEKWKYFVFGVSKVMLSYGGNHLYHSEWMSLSEEALEKLLLDKWSHTKSKDKDITKSLFSCGQIYITGSWLYS